MKMSNSKKLRDSLTQFGLPLILVIGLVGCRQKSTPEIVVYSALDREFSETILDDFQAASGIEVKAKYDVESTKTVGLVNTIMQESDRPRCDLFWNNEILHTIRLQEAGLLETYVASNASDFPTNYRDESGHWHGFAARARVLIVNTEKVPPEARPTSIRDLANPYWQGEVGIAKPMFGTTATHAAVIFSAWGEEEAKGFFRAVKDNGKVMSGNKQVAEAVASGELSFGLTDTDDAIIELEKGAPVEIVFPDQGEDGLGALFIPNTIAIVKGCPHLEEAKQLVDYLLQPETETLLARGRSAQFPLNEKAEGRPRVQPPKDVHWMEVDFAEAAKHWETAAPFLRDEFATAD